MIIKCKANIWIDIREKNSWWYCGQDGKSKDSGLHLSNVQSATTLNELQIELDSTNGREVVLVAVDGTWRNARRMVGRLPSNIPRLDIPSSVVHDLFANQGSPSSLLSPIRSKGPSQRAGGDDSLVCTAEAVVTAPKKLGLNSGDADRILSLARTKVDLVRRYRGHVRNE